MPNPQIDKKGTKRWFINGERHRIDGPAVEYANGDKHWYVNGEPHRLDGPAYEGSNGDKFWYVNGKRHRLNGPAFEWSDGTKEWYVYDVELSGPLKLLKHGAKLEELAEYLTPREIAQCRTQK